MTAWILLHRIPLGLVLLLAGTLTGLAFLFVPRGTSAPADAILISAPTPLAAFLTPKLPTPAATVAPTLPPTLTVYASGAVLHPGVYTLVGTARVSDLLRVAGGPAPGADLEQINLAARLHDEDHVSFPYQGTPAALAPPIQHAATPAAAAPGAGAGAPASGNAAKGDPAPASINLNTADAVALAALPGIGPSLAGRIVAYRTQHGPFARLEAVQDVSGIGPALYARMAPYLTLGR